MGRRTDCLARGDRLLDLCTGEPKYKAVMWSCCCHFIPIENSPLMHKSVIYLFLNPDSEGKGLSREDERSYSGQILVTEDDDTSGLTRTLFVRGSVVFGN